ncbi:MAG: GntR family transcriptional regulator [Hyphomicrobiaceae bacterium]|nr:GntR family transcriptional regulator [Hyphomicrobiaceae bacterium]
MLQKPDPPAHLSVKPLYVQLREALIARIANGEWSSGQALPNELDIAREFELSPGTVRKALDWMVGAGIVVRQQGRGTFVTDQSSMCRYERLRRADGSILVMDASSADVEEDMPSPRERACLGLGDRDRVYRLRRTRSADGRMVMVEEIAVPAASFPQLAGVKRVAYDLAGLVRERQHLLGPGSERLLLAPVPAEVAALLGLKPGDRVMMLQRVIRSLEDVALEMRTAWCVPGAYYHVPIE